MLGWCRACKCRMQALASSSNQKQQQSYYCLCIEACSGRRYMNAPTHTCYVQLQLQRHYGLYQRRDVLPAHLFQHANHTIHAVHVRMVNGSRVALCRSCHDEFHVPDQHGKKLDHACTASCQRYTERGDASSSHPPIHTHQPPPPSTHTSTQSTALMHTHHHTHHRTHPPSRVAVTTAQSATA